MLMAQLALDGLDSTEADAVVLPTDDAWWSGVWWSCVGQRSQLTARKSLEECGLDDGGAIKAFFAQLVRLP
jgi:hypothetical protein